MKRFAFVVAAALVSAGFAFAQPGDINIIPKPVSIEYGRGSFVFSSKTKIAALDTPSREAAAIFNDYLSKNYGFTLGVVKKRPFKDVIFFETVAGKSADAEDYEIQVDANAIRISGNQRGLFYGLQSFIQMIPVSYSGPIELPYVAISDLPRFKYRGMHLDVARHFMPVSFVKKYIDLMSQYKFNTFHWHLTEDQGWRIEIKKYPKLTEVGSKRPESVKERNLSPYIGDGIPHGGFYTQEEIKDVVKYAKLRFITVIPEIELPGHASAALAAYPQFGCKADYQYKVQTTWGIFKEVYCPTDATFKFLEDVLNETIALFPDSPYIHIGGDEVLKDHWKESAFVQELKKRENLKDEHEVQSYFVRRIEKYINSKGKKIIGWDEILEGGLAPNATVMSWRGMKGGIEAAKSKHDVIMTPTDYVYLDYGQGDPAYEPLNIGSYVPLEKVYSFDPVPPELTADEAKYVIGGQGNVWTEYIKTPSHIEYMAFPRMIALAEVLWSRAGAASFADFSNRLAAQFPRLDRQNVNYRIPEPGGLRNIVTENQTVSIPLKPAPGTVVIYTTDGSTPSVKTSEQYYEPIEIALKYGEVRTLKTIVVSAGGRMSVVYAATVVRGMHKEPIQITDFQPGVKYRIASHAEPNIKLSGVTRSLLMTQFREKIDFKSSFTAEFDGFFKAPVDGVYELQIETSGGGAIYFGTKKMIEANEAGARIVRTAIVPLKAGYHSVRLEYVHFGGDPNFRFRWGIKGQGLRQAYGGEFVH